MKACGAVRDSLDRVTICVKLMNSCASIAGRVPKTGSPDHLRARFERPTARHAGGY